ncbi:MAG: hypothetical protein PWR20_1885 [Bacteroidales bacterium]|jgi:hypothetical protein|nr:hypothetical protein [Bacteroidales bacterium]MDN5329048.1 hypothetical protein [Bacteroidales bacterium]
MIRQCLASAYKNTLNQYFSQQRIKQWENTLFAREKQMSECVQALYRVAWSRSRKVEYIEFTKFRYISFFEASSGWTDINFNTYITNNQNNAQPCYASQRMCGNHKTI